MNKDVHCTYTACTLDVHARTVGYCHSRAWAKGHRTLASAHSLPHLRLSHATHANTSHALRASRRLFLWFVLRRLVDIQGKLHQSRAMHKAAGGAAKGGVPMGMPVGQPAKPLKGE